MTYCKDKLQTVLQRQVTNSIAKTSYKQTRKIYKCGVHMKQTIEGQAYNNMKSSHDAVWCQTEAETAKGKHFQG